MCVKAPHTLLLIWRLIKPGLRICSIYLEIKLLHLGPSYKSSYPTFTSPEISMGPRTDLRHFFNYCSDQTKHSTGHMQQLLPYQIKSMDKIKPECYLGSLGSVSVAL